MIRIVKRILPILLALMLGVLPACAEESRIGADLSWERVVAFCDYMRELATGDYLDIKGVPQEQQDVAAQWAAGITGTPRMVIQLNVDELPAVVQTRALFRNEPDVVVLEAESTTVVEIWWTLAALGAQQSSVAESSYEEVMNINSYVNASTMYAEDAPEDSGVFLVFYENAVPIFLLTNAENGAVSIRGFFLPNAKLASSKNYGQVSMYMMLNGMTMTCKEVKP